VKNVRVKAGKVWFRNREDQLTCSGRWVVTRQSVNGSAPANLIEIPEPD
jgi:hypothetical protein